MKVLDVVPKMGSDKGGNPVHVWGHNFPNTSTGNYFCKFGTTQTNGTWLAWNHVECRAPKRAEGIVALEISPDGIEFTNDKVGLVPPIVFSIRAHAFFYLGGPYAACHRMALVSH